MANTGSCRQTESVCRSCDVLLWGTNVINCSFKRVGCELTHTICLSVSSVCFYREMQLFWPEILEWEETRYTDRPLNLSTLWQKSHFLLVLFGFAFRTAYWIVMWWSVLFTLKRVWRHWKHNEPNANTSVIIQRSKPQTSAATSKLLSAKARRITH